MMTDKTPIYVLEQDLDDLVLKYKDTMPKGILSVVILEYALSICCVALKKHEDFNQIRKDLKLLVDNIVDAAERVEKTGA